MSSNNGAFKKSAASQMNLIPRNVYKRVKSMDRIQLSGYINRIWMNGYEHGKKSQASESKSPAEGKTENAK